MDRLAALFQQYQVPAESRSSAVAAREVTRQTHDAQPPTPPPAEHIASTESTAVARGRAGVERQQFHGVQASAVADPAGTSHVREESELAKERASAASRTAYSSRLFAANAAPSPGVSAAARIAEMSALSAHRQPTQQEQSHGRPTVTLPASLSGSGVSGLMSTAVYVWAPLGFFAMRPSENDADSDTDNEGGSVVAGKEMPSVGSSVTVQEPSDPRDVEAFLFELEDFLGLFCAEATVTSNDTLAGYTALMRNGLWRVLFNAVFYCVVVLDEHRRHGALSVKEREVRTGGPEDAYEVVFPSSSSSAEEEDSEQGMEREVPVRLTWRVPGESAEERAARCVRDALPSDSPLRAGGPPYRSHVGTEDDAELGGSQRRNAATTMRVPLQDLYEGRLQAPLPVSDWHFILRCLAQVGYRRDSFYLQTPSSASPFELLLALLWLTQQYKLLGVAEYVELNRQYGFLLQYHVEDAFWRGGAAAHESTRERLLRHLADASVWPPVSFDENSAIHLRLIQLERCLGRPTPQEPLVHPGPSSPTTLQVRRIMTVQRLIHLSLNRLHHALQRQAEQTALLGLHSPLDAQLCCREHHDLYEEVMAGLTYVQETAGRLQSAAHALARAGSLVAFLLRYDESGMSAEDVLLALEEDDATWLDTVDGGRNSEGDDSSARRRRPRYTSEARGQTAADQWRRAVQRGALPPEQAAPSLPTSAAALAQSLSTFRATQSRASLAETWKRLLRRSHVAPHTIPPENLRFLVDSEAQQVQAARVRENMKSRYSLQAALAAELAVLGYERQQRRQRSPLHSPRRRGTKLVEESVSSRRTADADADVVARPVCVALPAMDLVTNAATTFAQLQAEEAAYGPVTLSTAELQLTEVGEPAAGSTTSARLELERLEAWEAELDEQLDARARTAERVTHCKKILETLYHQFGIRMATPIVPGRAH